MPFYFFFQKFQFQTQTFTILLDVNFIILMGSLFKDISLVFILSNFSFYWPTLQNDMSIAHQRRVNHFGEIEQLNSSISNSHILK